MGKKTEPFASFFSSTDCVKDKQKEESSKTFILNKICKLKIYNITVNLDSPMYGYKTDDNLELFQSLDSLKTAILKEIDNWAK